MEVGETKRGRRRGNWSRSFVSTSQVHYGGGGVRGHGKEYLEAAFSPAAAATPTLSVSVVAVAVAVRARTAGRARLGSAAGGVVELVALALGILIRLPRRISNATS
jgi:hypothetical protein